MAPMRVLVPLALLVVITLAEYPSSSKTTFLDKEVNQYEESLEESNNSEDFMTFIDEQNFNSARDATQSVTQKLPRMIIPQHYDIDLRINLTKFKERDYTYNGTVKIKLEITNDTEIIQLHCDTSLLHLIDATSVDKISNNITILNINYTNNIVTLSKSSGIFNSSNYTLVLEYKGTVNDKNRGFYKGSYLNEDNKMRWYVATHFEPISARSAFPCFDEPALKATFKISLTYDKGYTAISNMIGKTESIGNDRQKTTFETTPKMSTYLVAYAIADFKAFKEDNVTVYARPRPTDQGMTKYAAEVGNKVLRLLEEYTNITYSSMIRKMDQIALPLLSPGAMENWGLVTYRETKIFYNENVNMTIDKQRVAGIIAHEFAHQWFGNLVTPEWWTYIWLNEGFADYFQYFIIDKIYPDWRYMEQFNVLSLQTNAFHYDGDREKTRPMNSNEKSENKINDLFDDIAYNKAAAVIRMFSHILGEDKFQEGLQNYLDSRKYKNVIPKDLYESLDKVADKKSLPKDVNLTTIFENWTNQAGYPVITVTKNRTGENASIIVTQKPFYLVESNEEENKGWHIPLNYVQQTENIYFNNTSVTLWLIYDGNESSIVINENIEKEGWIIFNVQQTGYYRVNYDLETWSDIIKYLNTDNFTIIHPLNRAQLIDDAFHLALPNHLNINITLDLIKFLGNENDYIVWKSAFKILSKLNTLLGRTEFYGDFLKFVEPIIENLLNNVTLVESKNEPHLTKLLRVDAAKLACDIGFEPFNKISMDEFNLWINNQNATISRDLKKVYLCGALKKADVTVWKATLNKYLLSTDNEEKAVILSSLGCSLSPEILKNFLEIAIQKELIVHLPEIFRSIYSNSAIGVDVVLHFISKNLEKLQNYDEKFDENIVNILTELANRIAITTDVGMLNDIIYELSAVKKLEKGLSEIRQIANRNNKFLENHSGDIQKWLKEYLSNIPSIMTPNPKPSSADSLSFSIALISVSLLLVRLR